MRTARLLVALFAASLPAAGCLPDIATDPFFDRSCSSLSSASVEGTWTIRGEGRREACADAALDADVLHIDSIPLEVDQVGTAIMLRTVPSVPGGSFALVDGQVMGPCVRFSTIEQSADGAIVRLDFDGRRSGSTLAGTFSGGGPGTCRVEGDFTVTLTP